MRKYKFSLVPDGIEVRQVAIFPQTLGGLVAFGGLLGLFFLSRDIDSGTGMDLWMPLLISAGCTLGGLYLLLVHPTIMRFRLCNGIIQIFECGLLNCRERRAHHSGLGSLSIQESDNDGKWYMPTIGLEGGECVELGFGCATEADAKNVIDRIVELYSNSRVDGA
jgi:hypothetical protein